MSRRWLSTCTDAHVSSLQVKGISSIGGHAAERTACVNEFVRLFGGMPLVHRELRTHAVPWRLRLSTLLDRAI